MSGRAVQHQLRPAPGTQDRRVRLPVRVEPGAVRSLRAARAMPEPRPIASHAAGRRTLRSNPGSKTGTENGRVPKRHVPPQRGRGNHQRVGPWLRPAPLSLSGAGQELSAELVHRSGLQPQALVPSTRLGTAASGRSGGSTALPRPCNLSTHQGDPFACEQNGRMKALTPAHPDKLRRKAPPCSDQAYLENVACRSASRRPAPRQTGSSAESDYHFGPSARIRRPQCSGRPLLAK